MIHWNFFRAEEERARNSGEPPRTDAAVQHWSLLDEDYKNANRQQALHLKIKLRTIACAEQDKSIVGRRIDEFTDEEIKLLAVMEHDRWCAERWLAGWVHGKTRNKVERTHPDLVPWSELSEDSQEKDRESVRQIPRLLKVVRRNSVEEI